MKSCHYMCTLHYNRLGMAQLDNYLHMLTKSMFKYSDHVMYELSTVHNLISS